MEALDLANKRPLGHDRTSAPQKRAKYTSAACKACKRSKVKCIRMQEGADCQRCASMRTPCIIVTKERAKDGAGESMRGDNDSTKVSQLSGDLMSLREQLSVLASTVTTLVDRQATPTDSASQVAPRSPPTSPKNAEPGSPQRHDLAQPQFIGPTRSAYSLNIAEASLTGMNTSGHQVSSREDSPEAPTRPSPYSHVATGVDVLVSVSVDEATRLINVYREEALSVYPIVDAEWLIGNVPRILNLAKQPQSRSHTEARQNRLDMHILRLAIATAMILEMHGKNELSDRLIDSVEDDLGRISRKSPVLLKDLQITGMLSIYFCHTDEDLFAWRAIGRGVRQALEMGLHRKQSLMANFRPDERPLAVQVFWVVYQLDRRWSFGTSLSFALNDKDIDPELPEPSNFPFLACTIAHGRLCSKVWDALPPYSAPSQLVPKDAEDYIDYLIQNWIKEIPEELQLRSPLVNFAMQQSETTQRLRTLLHLRGNYLRLLIHRHHVLSVANINRDRKTVQLVVDIALNSIQVLVSCNASSNIYKRQPNVYSYYLLNALAIVLLAVCHAPETFAESCRSSFTASIDLLRSFSRYSTASRKLWKTIRAILPAVQALSPQTTSNLNESGSTASHIDSATDQADLAQNIAQNNLELAGHQIDNVASYTWPNDGGHHDQDLEYMPDMFDLGVDLQNLYNTFGSATVVSQPLQSDTAMGQFASHNMVSWEYGDISQHFQGLL
ncbi:fungal-specific transcription factor domain-containing protein [Paraphoma chrysanthemicola]|uniref:Fungal-specific transcription factor domain-containing protein n=1 Tax=Paraphoma chrysanthemicola TaxID=798071 RepID=A0A8K0QVK5_9PLEO|nr:fungal-specific transcription factor domain-containing protein [Paraphoma chrysanthemicola]